MRFIYNKPKSELGKKIYPLIKTIIDLLMIPPNLFIPKVFCISMQKNGTTSCGRFLQDHGYRLCGYGEHSLKWAHYWLQGDYEKIFRSRRFRAFHAFEDTPWWVPDFYKYLNRKFKNAKFILFYRDSNEWFDSMLNHLEGKAFGNTHFHCKVYRRMEEFYSELDNNPQFKPLEKDRDNLFSLKGKREHYVKIYDEHNRGVMEYFKRYAPDKLIALNLKDEKKWQKLGTFLGKKVDPEYNAHLNTSEHRRKINMVLLKDK